MTTMVGRVLSCLLFVSTFGAYLTDSASNPCRPKSFGQSSTVCVCNAQSCDTVEPVGTRSAHQYAVYQSIITGDRLNKTLGGVADKNNSHEMCKRTVKLQSTSLVEEIYDCCEDDRYILVLTIHPDVTHQTILGFGGAVTDAAGINLYSLSAGAQQNLLQSYFATDGIEYNVIRVPMASCDFSTHPYSYDDTPLDFDLKNFSLAMEDIKYKIPVIQMAQKLARRKMTIFGSPWSAPAWMKTNQNMTGKGSLIGQPGGKYFKTWANYFLKFLQEYDKHNISFWGLTGQNEPSDGEIVKFSFQAMGWTPEMQRDFIAIDLGPTLHQSGYGNVTLMILDDQRIFLPHWAEVVLQNEKANSYVGGVAVHWYIDFVVPPITLDNTHKAFPGKFIFSTEACNGEFPWEQKVILGSWERAEAYAHDIITDLNHWVVGWTDWNIALDMEGGPNWVNNFVDSPIIVNAKNDEFYKQPMFYAMGHFSKFVLPGSTRVEVTSSSPTSLEYVAVSLPDNTKAIVILNRENIPIAFSLFQPGVGYINSVSPARSIQTILW